MNSKNEKIRGGGKKNETSLLSTSSEVSKRVKKTFRAKVNATKDKIER